jgi:hypothetical protein
MASSIASRTGSHLLRGSAICPRRVTLQPLSCGLARLWHQCVTPGQLTKNLRAVQFLLGHSKLESTVRYLGIEVDDALEISEQTEI